MPLSSRSTRPAPKACTSPHSCSPIRAAFRVGRSCGAPAGRRQEPAASAGADCGRCGRDGRQPGCRRGGSSAGGAPGCCRAGHRRFVPRASTGSRTTRSRSSCSRRSTRIISPTAPCFSVSAGSISATAGSPTPGRCWKGKRRRSPSVPVCSIGARGRQARRSPGRARILAHARSLDPSNARVHSCSG